MELKSANRYGELDTREGFNRTFMELKFPQATAHAPATFGFNRTFMELKSPSFARMYLANFVLIVPLWN